ncbi:FAD-binding oxidoreductase [Sphingomonas sabuli]|uniref:FAD-binding oxidoreductase n=1 Tax=Sphingomonas sabuli TaxID=2764186 RepID=A0A7G9L312_9SPHN|nr:FAD-dependent oxidoreductase [Sphingomonas sabuli]QNM83011.1 FAD-binding oxidoreductase [Sphingomonas sabuli]
MLDCDVLIVGGGIAGASLGAELAPRACVLIVEAESLCGTHATGRSAAFWLESYGGPVVSPLSTASRPFLDAPPADFSDRGFLRTRGDVHLTRDALPVLPEGIESRVMERDELERVIPGIRPQWRRALFEPGCADIDVAGLHAAYLRAFRKRGGTVRTDATLRQARREGGAWAATMADGSTVSAGVIVNAAGAWADPVATACGVAPIGIAPKRRTMVQLRVGRTGLRDLPLVDDAGGTFYFKGESDNSVWLSPHDEIATGPCDAAPEEVDVAIAIDRFQQVVDWPVEAVERKWAGLRSFAPDRVPVYGFDPDVDGFFWCVGQGGFGIQTAPAAARMTAALLLGRAPDAMVEAIDPAPFSPARFR